MFQWCLERVVFILDICKMEIENIQEFHQRLKLMLVEIHKICVGNGIKYTMIGGSLLGALRHQGFIPWDDDMDIAMTYDNYKRFLEIVTTMKHDWLEFETAGLSVGCYQPFLKAYDNRTTFLEGHMDSPKGIFIDIFPICKCGNSLKDALRERRKYRFWQSLLKRKGYKFHTGGLRETILGNMAKCFSVDFLVGKLRNQMEVLSLKDYAYSADFDGTVKGIVPSYLFKSYSLYKFNDNEFMGITEAEQYLRLVFGDYMQLPPVEKQVPHHIAYMNLDLPYREYVKLQKHK